MASEVGIKRDIEQNATLEPFGRARVPGRASFPLWLGLLISVAMATILCPGQRAMGAEARDPGRLYQGEYRPQLQAQPTASDPARVAKNLGPIAGIFGGRLSSQCVDCTDLYVRAGSRVVGPVASPVRSLASSLGPLAYDEVPIWRRPVYWGPGQAHGFTGPLWLLGPSLLRGPQPYVVFWGVAQLVEQPLDKRQVLGSSPSAPTTLFLQ